jgi:hypothetical protein
MHWLYKAKWESDEFGYDARGSDDGPFYGTTSEFTLRDIGNP